MTVVQEITRKIRIKLPTKKVEVAGEKGSCRYGQEIVIVDKCSHSISAGGNRNHVMNKSHEFVRCSSNEAKRDTPAASLMIKLSASGDRKRREPSGKSEIQKGKRQKIDRNISLQCGKILKTLMSHRDSYPFLVPVDPVALNIPDYFSIISHPMDLGTVKSKLQNNEYFDGEEFAADVILIFSNAMTYNPPNNEVHSMAKRLDNVFRRSWKSLEAKWGHERNSAKLRSCESEKTELAEVLQKTSHKRLLNDSLSTRAPKMEPAKMTQSSAPLLAVKFTKDGGGNRSACCITKTKPPFNLQNEAANASSSDLSSERSFGQDNGVLKMERVKEKLVFRICKSDLDSDGAVSALDGECSLSTPRLSTPTKDETSGEVWTPAIDLQLSPTKALRAAMLKSRFADTIFKAKQRTLLDYGKAAPMKIQQEKERLERQQREEKAKIEAQIRAAEAASRLKAETELKMKREREREAARLELEKMERSVDIDDNQVLLKDLKMLIMEYEEETVEGGGNPLERLGLFIKKDYFIGKVYEEEEEDEAILHVNGEEGEIS